jgi:hypothetical protein
LFGISSTSGGYRNESKLDDLYCVNLQSILDIENTTEEFYYEYFYSRFLELILPLFEKLLKEKTKWRLLESLLIKIAGCLKYFNPVEIQDLFLFKLLNCIKNSNHQIKRACAIFIASLIHH